MNIQIEFIGFPLIYDIFPEGRYRYNFDGETIPQLVQDVIAQKGERVKESLLVAEPDQLDPTIQISVNRRFISKDEISCHRIEEGDCVAFVRLLAGG